MWNKVHNLVNMIKDADFLGLDDVKDQGIQFLLSNLDFHNALAAYHLSNLYCNILLKDTSQEFILQNFDIISETDEFINLDVVLIKDIL